MRRRPPAVLLVVAIVGLVVAGCDKCGHRISPNAPSLPTSCGDNAGPSDK